MKSGTFVQCMILVVTVLFVFQGCAGRAGAHAVVIESSPPNGATLAIPPAEVVLRFNARIEKGLARVSLSTSAGQAIPLPLPEPGKADSPDRLVIPLPRLGPGVYLLRYKVLATDGHATLGGLSFTVTGGK